MINDSLIRKFCDVHSILPTDTIIVGVSGWVDSMVLLSLLMECFPREQIIAVHINHGLRGEESDADARMVEAFCEEQRLRFEMLSVDVAALSKERKLSTESAGREIRREFFERMRDQYHASSIWLAHHQDDQVETVLFNFIRGSRLRWLSGIREYDGVYARPFLGVSKQDIRTFAELHSIPFREDSSNTSLEYQRNRIRNQIIPELEAINPEVRTTIARFAQYAQELEVFFEESIEHFVAQNPFTTSEYSLLPPLLQRSIVESLYREANGTNIGLSEGNIEELRRFILEANGGTEKMLGNLKLTKKQGKILRK